LPAGPTVHSAVSPTVTPDSATDFFRVGPAAGVGSVIGCLLSRSRQPRTGRMAAGYRQIVAECGGSVDRDDGASDHAALEQRGEGAGQVVERNDAGTDTVEMPGHEIGFDAPPHGAAQFARRRR